MRGFAQLSLFTSSVAMLKIVLGTGAIFLNVTISKFTTIRLNQRDFTEFRTAAANASSYPAMLRVQFRSCSTN